MMNVESYFLLFFDHVPLAKNILCILSMHIKEASCFFTIVKPQEKTEFSENYTNLQLKKTSNCNSNY